MPKDNNFHKASLLFELGAFLNRIFGFFGTWVTNVLSAASMIAGLLAS